MKRILLTLVILALGAANCSYAMKKKKKKRITRTYALIKAKKEMNYNKEKFSALYEKPTAERLDTGIHRYKVEFRKKPQEAEKNTPVIIRIQTTEDSISSIQIQLDEVQKLFTFESHEIPNNQRAQDFLAGFAQKLQDIETSTPDALGGKPVAKAVRKIILKYLKSLQQPTQK